MATVCHPSLVLPNHRVDEAQLKELAVKFLGEDFRHLSKVMKIIENAGVKSRYVLRPPMDVMKGEGLGVRNDQFIEAFKELGTQAAKEAIDNAGLQPDEIDMVITTSCTGFMIPSVCAHMIPTLGMKPTTKRLPITELGCAAGAVAISRAREFIAAYPNKNVLIVAGEFCSATFQPSDFSMQALVSAILFGDGVAACVVRGDDDASGFKLDANGSHLFDDSWHYMGFDVRDTGFHIILDKGIPGAVERQIGPAMTAFLDANRVEKDQLDFFCIHPGGRKLVDEVERLFSMKPDHSAASRECLAEVGNLSSASVIVVLKNLFERYRPDAGQRGLLAAFGPGFCTEMSLGTWNEKSDDSGATA